MHELLKKFKRSGSSSCRSCSKRGPGIGGEKRRFFLIWMEVAENK